MPEVNPLKPLSMANEDYLEAVWRIMLERDDDSVRSVAVADGEACEMEHALSQDTMDRLLTYLEREGTVVDGDLDG